MFATLTRDEAKALQGMIGRAVHRTGSKSRVSLRFNQGARAVTYLAIQGELGELHTELFYLLCPEYAGS